MAATLTDAGELTFVSFPIEKTETTEDGDLVVFGKATDGSVDHDSKWSCRLLPGRRSPSG